MYSDRAYLSGLSGVDVLVLAISAAILDHSGPSADDTQ